ncbi:TPM domain-containing protein [Enterococcus sp. LJL99]
MKTTKLNKLTKRITSQYTGLKTRNQILIISLLLIFLLSGIFFSKLFFIDSTYKSKMNGYDVHLQKLIQEKKTIESGATKLESKSFETLLQENMDNLKDYPQKEDNYDVSIQGTEGSLKINKNNIFVSDNANLLSKKTKQKIYDFNKQLAASTSGSQLAVITINKLPKDADIESYANKLFNQLGIGDKQENNGVLYLIALEDRKFRLEVGYGLEGLIPDGTADDIINADQVVDEFKASNFDAAVTLVIEQVFSLMNTKTALVDSKIAQIEKQKSSTNFFYWTTGILLAISLITTSLLMIGIIRASKSLKQHYENYCELLNRSTTNTDEQIRLKQIKSTDFYYIVLSAASLFLSKASIQRAITRGKLLKNPLSEKKGFGRVLVGDTLYSSNGSILTTAYLTSNYNSSNWSNDHSDSGNSSWDSFGGGSSGGGGASGGW